MAFTIEFDQGGEKVLFINSDKHIENQRRIVERRIGKNLPVDPRTGFPNFTIYEDGEEHSGG